MGAEWLSGKRSYIPSSRGWAKEDKTGRGEMRREGNPIIHSSSERGT